VFLSLCFARTIQMGTLHSHVIYGDLQVDQLMCGYKTTCTYDLKKVFSRAPCFIRATDVDGEHAVRKWRRTYALYDLCQNVSLIDAGFFSLVPPPFPPLLR